MAQYKTLGEISRRALEEISLDFIVNELPRREIVNKYHLSDDMLTAIVKQLELHKKRDAYRKKVLDKSLERCSTLQSKIIYKATDMLATHIDDLSKIKKKKPDVPLSSGEIRDVMAIFALISKENKLSNDQATERIVSKVKVEFSDTFVPINAEYKEIEEAEVVKEDKDDDGLITEL